MTVLRIHSRILDEPLRCQWAYVDKGGELVAGEGLTADVPKRAGSVQLIVPAAEILLTRTRLPKSAARRGGPVLAFAVEEETVREPDANEVSWIGSVAEGDVLAVVDKNRLKQCLDTLDAAAIKLDGVYCETLLLPWVPGEWSLAWNGHESFVRTGEFEGGATDCGDEASPPLSLRLMLEDAGTRAARPGSIAFYTNTAACELIGETGAPPHMEAWQRELGVPIRFAGGWDWRRTSLCSSVNLLQGGKLCQLFSGLLPRLRTAGWIVAVALAIHPVGLITDRVLLANEQQALRQQMDARFRAIFPAAVAVVDPALQMRRKLVERRRSAGLLDKDDFLPTIGAVGPALVDLAPGALRTVSYESGKMTLELAVDEVLGAHIVTCLRELDLGVHVASVPADAGSGNLTLIVSAL